MARKTTWKDICIDSSWQWRALRSYYGSSKGAWTSYTVEFDGGNYWILTNLPWAEIRAWFVFAGVPLPKDILTSNERPYRDE